MEKKEEKKDEAALKRLAEIYRHPYGSAFLHFFQERSENLFFFDLKADRGKIVTVLDFKSPDQFDSVQVANRIFLCGGYRLDTAKPTFLKDHYECLIEMPKRQFARMHPKAPLVHERAQHALCAIKDGMIYCMGGKSNASGKLECLNFAEKYDIKADKWVEIPPMNEKKMNVSACAFNQETVFAFGGYNYSLGGALATIEWLDTNKETEGWKVFEITKQMLTLWKPHYWMGLYHFATDKIAIFGGNNTDASFVFNVKEKTLEKCERQISYRVNFCQRKAELWNNEIKCADYIRKDVNIFSIEKYYWSDQDHEYAFYPRKPIKLPDPPQY